MTTDKPDLATIKKIIHMSGRQWGGYLTAAEIVQLFKLGARSDYGTSNNLDYAKKRVKEGNSTPYWFYFTLSEKSELYRLINA